MSASIREIISRRPAVSVDPAETLRTVATLLAHQNIGALPVTLGFDVVGIISERDLVHRALGRWMNPDDTLVREVMTPDPECIDIGAPFTAALKVMRQRRCRHVPVLASGRLAGMVSMRDLPVEQTLPHVLPYAADGQAASRIF